MIAGSMRLPPAVLAAALASACAFDSPGGSGTAFVPGPATEGDDDGTSATTASADSTSGPVAPTTTAGDATTDPGNETTDTSDGPSPFGDPQAVSELNDNVFNDEDPTLSPDMLEIFFASDRDGTYDIWTSRRGTTALPWSPPTSLAALNSPSVERSPELTGDGLTLLMVSDRNPGLGLEVYMSTRPEGGAWGPPTWVMDLSSSSDEVAATPVVDSDVVLLCSNRPRGLGGFDLYQTMILRGGSFAPVAPLGLSTGASECAMAMRGDQLEIVFASDRPGSVGANDLWHATRDFAGDAFSPPEPVALINTSADDDAPWLSPSGETLFFSSTRAGPTHDLFVAER
jgi:hypothetical protein